MNNYIFIKTRINEFEVINIKEKSVKDKYTKLTHYTINIKENKLFCECPDFVYRHKENNTFCKHLNMLSDSIYYGSFSLIKDILNDKRYFIFENNKHIYFENKQIFINEMKFLLDGIIKNIIFYGVDEKNILLQLEKNICLKKYIDDLQIYFKNIIYKIENNYEFYEIEVEEEKKEEIFDLNSEFEIKKISSIMKVSNKIIDKKNLLKNKFKSLQINTNLINKKEINIKNDDFIESFNDFGINENKEFIMKKIKKINDKIALNRKKLDGEKLYFNQIIKKLNDKKNILQKKL